MIYSRVDCAGVEVRIGECHLDSDSCIAWQDAFDLLDEGERDRADAFAFDRDRDRFVRAHGFVKRVLAKVAKVAPDELTIAAEAGGKPFVIGHDIDFNLSHSGPWAAIAVTRGRAIGIDIETIDRSLGDLSDLFNACLVADEQDALAPLAPSEQRRRFLSYWTAKEARMKLTGEGMMLEPTSIALDLIDGRARGYLKPALPAAEMRFVPLSSSDTICCLAVAREKAPVASVQ